MKLDEAIIEELERSGEGTVKDIQDRISSRVQHAFERLVKEKKITKSGHEGQGNIKYYDLPKPAPVIRRI